MINAGTCWEIPLSKSWVVHHSTFKRINNCTSFEDSQAVLTKRLQHRTSRGQHLLISIKKYCKILEEIWLAKMATVSLTKNLPIISQCYFLPIHEWYSTRGAKTSIFFFSVFSFFSCILTHILIMSIFYAIIKFFTANKTFKHYLFFFTKIWLYLSDLKIK